MGEPPFNRAWMYDRCYSGRRGLKESFVLGVEEFVRVARQSRYFELESGIRCPCIKCDCTRIFADEVVKVHLYKKGFIPNYWIWTLHGEDMPAIDLHEGDNYVFRDGVRIVEMEQLCDMEEMVNNALCQFQSTQQPNDTNLEECPNESTQRFYNLLAEANQPLFEGARDSKFSVCVRLLSYKSNWNIPNQCLEAFTKLLLDLTPPNMSLSKSYYDVKRLVSKLGLEAKKIDCCVCSCMLFYDNDSGKKDAALLECKFCHKPRYHPLHQGSRRNKPIVVKSMFYLPIILRLQRMFASMQTAPHMTWHHDNQSQGMLRHPSDGEAWKHFDHKHPTFASDARNVRLGLCSDGFNPYI